MDDWGKAPVFGVRIGGEAWGVRPSAYGVVEDGQGRLAVVRTPQGVFLPGGGQAAGETPEKAIEREAMEECGLGIRLGPWTTHAVQFIFSKQDRAHFEKPSTFIAAVAEGPAGIPTEKNHELVWADPETAVELLSQESHRWAVRQWRRR
jgi:8-oxo-dGTP diphosphatase